MQKRNAALTTLLWIGGLPALFWLLSHPSEQENSVLFGFSLTRLVIAALILLAVGGLAFLSGVILKQPEWWRKFTQKQASRLRSRNWIFSISLILFTAFFVIAALIILAVSPASLELTLLKTFVNSLGFTLAWLEIGILFLGLLLYLNTKHLVNWKTLFTPIRLATCLFILTVVYTVTVKVFMKLTWDIRMRHLEEFIFLPVLVFMIWALLYKSFSGRKWYAAASQALLLIAIGVTSYVIYRHSAQWMEWIHSPNKAYWPELAEAFLQGRLYLVNPSTQHDLTLYFGNWYVPNPPLPALVLMPLVAIFGAEKINMVLFSIVIGSINVVLVYLILDKASRLGLIPTNKAGNLLITTLFAFGTSHWWLSMMGMMWFVSQLLTLTFSALAVLGALHRKSPWWVGLCLGLSMLSRPNVFTLWPLLAGIALYFFYQEDGKFNFLRSMKWAVQSAIPIGLAGVLLLYYNYIRFGDFTDFGYVTINSAEWLMSAVKTYGIFNSHFLPINAKMMFLKRPYISFTDLCFYYSPSRDGVSILSMSPAIIYLFRRFKFNIWTAGAWISVILSIVLLLFYHNTGAAQLGYRYLMDFILPVLLLLGIGIGRISSWLFKALVVLSIASYALGIIWWFAKWWC